MGLPLVATEFWIGTEPTLDFTSGGRGYCKFRVKAVDRVKDDTAEGGWRDGKTLWATATVWDGQGKRTTAQNVFESFKKGDDVILSGKIYTREYETENKEKRMSVDIDVQEIGPSLHFRQTPHGAKKEQQQATTRQPATQNQQVTAPASSGNPDSEPPF